MSRLAKVSSHFMGYSFRELLVLLLHTIIKLFHTRAQQLVGLLWLLCMHIIYILSSHNSLQMSAACVSLCREGLWAIYDVVCA